MAVRESLEIPFNRQPSGEGKKIETHAIETPRLTIVPLDFTDTQAFVQASAPRTEDDYTQANLNSNYRMLPPSIGRPLVSPDFCIENLQNAAKRAEDFKLLVIRHKLLFQWQPLDLVGSFRYPQGDTEETRVSGVIMASQLSSLKGWSDGELKAFPADERKEIIEERFGEFLELPGHDVHVIALPSPEREGLATSPTHNALLDTDGIVAHPQTGLRFQTIQGEDGQINNLYVYAHGSSRSHRQEENMRKARSLMTDENFYEETARIGLAWRENIRHVAALPPKPEQEALAQKQTLQLADLLRKTNSKKYSK